MKEDNQGVRHRLMLKKTSKVANLQLICNTSRLDLSMKKCHKEEKKEKNAPVAKEPKIAVL